MASTIQSQTIVGASDKCIALAASQFGRPHGYGNNWSTLRIALNCNFEDLGADITASLLRIGLCNGTANMPGDATTNNSYGIKFQPFWQREATTPVDFYTGSGVGAYPLAFSRIGNTETTSLISETVRVGVVNGKRSCFFLDIIKGSPNYTFKFFSPLTINFADTIPATFLTQAVNPAPTLASYLYMSPTGTALAIDTATNGILDAVYVGWNKLTPRLFIGNIAVVKLA